MTKEDYEKEIRSLIRERDEWHGECNEWKHRAQLAEKRADDLEKIAVFDQQRAARIKRRFRKCQQQIANLAARTAEVLEQQ